MKKVLLLLTLALFGYTTQATIQETNTIEPTEITPAPGSIIRTLDLITLIFAEDVDFNLNTVITVTRNEAETVGSAKLVYHESDYDKFYVRLSQPLQEAGIYHITIPAGSIWDDQTRTKKSPELTYTYTVDPEYWNPEWIYEVGEESKSAEAPFQLTTGYKYQFNQIHNYVQYTAKETGRLIFTPIDGSSLSLTLHDDQWMWLKELPRMEDGSYWLGVEVGKTYNIKDYLMFGKHTFKLTFESAIPYEAIQLFESWPDNGGKYNILIPGRYSYINGTVDFVFSTQVNTETWKISIVFPSKGNTGIDITNYVKFKTGTAWKGSEKFGFYYSLQLAELIEGLISEYGLKSGDEMQVVLSHIQDIEHADNILQEDAICNLSLVATVCTSINPHPNEKLSEVPQEMVLTFNNPTIGTGGRLIEPLTGKEVAFDASCFSSSSSEESSVQGIIHQTTIKLPTDEFKLSTRQFQVELFNMIDAKGNAVTYGDKEDKFIINYNLRDDTFEPIKITPEDNEAVSIIKETRLTFAEEVNIAPNAPHPLLSNDGETSIEGSLSIAADDPKTVVITWNEEITQAGEYYISVNAYSIYDSKFNPDKKDYGLADGASANPDINLSHVIAADFSTTTVRSISPIHFESSQKSIEQLPEEITITLSGNPQSINTIYGFGVGGMAPFATEDAEEIPENADILAATIIGNQIIVSIPKSVITANKDYEYTIVMSVTGEDGKPISANPSDPFDAHIQFSYYLLDVLTLTESAPTDSAQVESIKEITLTFESKLYPTYDPDNATDEKEGWKSPAILARVDKLEVIAERLVPEITGNQATFTLPETITEDGIYELTIPDGVFYESTWNTNRECLRNEAQTLTFIIGDINITTVNPAVNDIRPNKKNDVTVYSITGIVITQGNASEALKRLPNGIYIINGRKEMINNQ